MDGNLIKISQNTEPRMGIPTKHKTVQNRILDYMQVMGWTLVSRVDAGAQRGFNNSQFKPADQAKTSPHSSLTHCSTRPRR